MSTPYFRPQTSVQQEFEPLAGTIVQPQNVLLIGPNYRVFESDDAADLLSINYGAYVPGSDTDYDYAGKPTGAVVDTASLSLLLKDIFAQYASLSGANVIERGVNANELRITTANGFKAYDNGTTSYVRNAVFGNRDVKVGDRVRVVGTAVDFKSRIIGFKNATIAAAVASPVISGSQATQSHATTGATVAAQSTDHVSHGTGTYLGSLADGVINDVYTLTCTTAGVGAVKQVETATVAGSIGGSGAGNATVIVTSALVTGSPLTTSVAVANSDSAATVAGKIRTALGAVTAITDVFTVGGASATVSLTRTIAGANDATLNISIDNGTCTGLTAAPTSVDTLAGVLGTALFSVTSTSGDNVAEVSLANVAFGVNFAVGTRGATLNFTSAGTQAFVVDEQYTLTCAAAFARMTPSRTSGATVYDGTFDAVYTIKVVKGGTWDEEPQVSVTTNNGIDSAPPSVVDVATNFLVGSLGITAAIADNTQDGLLLNDTFTIAATASKLGAVRVALISNPIPSTLVAGDDLTVTFYIYKAEQAIPLSGYPDFADVALTATTDNFTVKAGIAITDSSWTDGMGNLDPLLVKYASVIVPYRALLTAAADDTHSLSDASAISAVLGKVIVGNPLAYGMDKALANSGGQTVYYIPVATNDLAGYREALAAHQTDQQGYLVVFLSEDTAIRDLLDAHVTNMSAPTGAKRCIAFVPAIIDELTTKYGKKDSGENWTGFVFEDPDNTGEFTYVSVPDATFITDGIRATDIFRSSFGVDALGNDTYSAYVIDRVIDEETLVLKAPAFDAEVGAADDLQRIQIVRNLTYDEQAQAVQADSEALKNRRVYSVFPDFPIEVAWPFLAAAVAGYASSVAPHQPITNVSLNGFTDQNGARKRFTPTQLDTMAEGGTLIVSRPKNGGSTFIRHQLSTDNTDDNRSELSVTRNLDSMCDALEADLKGFVGKYNSTPDMLQLAQTIVVQKLTYFMTETRTVTAGPQLLGYNDKTLSVVQSQLARTQVDVNIDGDLPLPVNRVSLTFRVSA